MRCNDCDNRIRPSSIVEKAGHLLSADDISWIAEAREMYCAECYKNKPQHEYADIQSWGGPTEPGEA